MLLPLRIRQTLPSSSAPAAAHKLNITPDDGAVLRCLLRLLCRATKGRPTSVDAVTLGDTWLQRAIAEGLIQPIPDARQYRWWVSAACTACTASAPQPGGGKPEAPAKSEP